MFTPGFFQRGLRPLLADIGQWACADQAGHGASDNLMTYADGDPINLTDVNGLCGSSCYDIQARTAADMARLQATYDQAMSDDRSQREAWFNSVDSSFASRRSASRQPDLDNDY